MGIWNILVLVPISIQGKGPEQHTHVKVSYIDRPWGSLPHFFPFTSLIDHTFEISTIMSLVDITLHLLPPSQCRRSTQFTIPTALRNGYEKMGILGSGVFTPAIPTASDLNHAQELTNLHLVVRKPLGGGEFVWKEFLSRYAIRLGVSEYLPFTASAPSGEVLQDAPSCVVLPRFYADFYIVRNKIHQTTGIFDDVDHSKSRGVTYWAERIGPLVGHIIQVGRCMAFEASQKKPCVIL